MADDVTTIFAGVEELAIFEGSTCARFYCTITTAREGLGKLRDNKLMLLTLRESITKGALRIPVANESLWNSGTKFVFKNAMQIESILPKLPSPMPLSSTNSRTALQGKRRKRCSAP